MLGRLERIKAIRTVWADEARDFTPWLARPENLAALAEVLGLGADGLELEAVEASVGAFSADILCRETSPEGGLVLIENMFGRSDHDHLGKILTYASGLKARSVVLLAEDIREEHRAALDWLNSITDDQHNFFACEIELWRIGDSAPAPRFNLVVKPNDWTKEIGRSIQPGPLSDLKQTYQKYWEAFVSALMARQSRIRSRKPLPQHWLDFAIGKSGVTLTGALSSTEQRIRVELFLNGPSAKTWFAQLERQRAEIEAEVGTALDWDPLPERQGARISVALHSANPIDQASWPNLQDWMVGRFIAFDRAFRPRVALLADASVTAGIGDA